jgi:thiamine-phosphate pyrophosphorylase
VDSGAQRSGDERRARLRAARLYLVVELRVAGADVEALVHEAVGGGVDVVQVRDKHASDAEIVDAARRLARACERRGALLIVNDRPDLALAADADGVHVGQDDAAADEVRETVGSELLIGLSTHAPAEIDAAGASEADYIGVGPVYRTATKPALAPAGLELVRYAAAHARQPFFAIGGIDARRAPEVAAAGADRVAVVRAIRDAPDPRAAAIGLRAALEAALDREPVGGAAR